MKNQKYADRLNSIWTKLSEENKAGSSASTEAAEEISLQIDWNCSCCDSGCKSSPSEENDDGYNTDSNSFTPSL